MACYKRVIINNKIIVICVVSVCSGQSEWSGDERNRH